MWEPKKCKIPSLGDILVLQEFVDMFEEIPGLSPKGDIDFFIDSVLRVALVSKVPYIMSSWLEEVKNVVGRIVE